MDDDQYSDDYDEEVYDDEMDEGLAPPASSTLQTEDKTVHVDVAQDGSKLEAKTPEGTRVATPLEGQAASTSAAATSSSSAPGETATASTSTAGTSADSSKPASYAAALQKKPVDWHLEFSMGTTPVRLKQTVYGVIHEFEANSQATAAQTQQRQQRGPGYIWSNVYTLKYKKVAGPAPSEGKNFDDLLDPWSDQH